MSYKLLALDMDGTTFHSLDDIVEENVEPINKALKRGIKVVFVTGRPIHSKLNRLELFDFSNDGAIFAGFNGALIYDLKKKEALDSNPIDKEIALKIFQIWESEEEFKNIELWAYTINDELSYINMPLANSQHLTHEVNFFDFEPVVFKKGMEMLDCHKFLAMKPSLKFVNKLKELGLNVSWTEGASLAAEITKNGINKKHALEFLCDKFLMTSDEVLAIGDGANDLPMFEFAGYSIAPANAHDKIKAQATEVSEYSNLEGAVAKAIYKYILGE